MQNEPLIESAVAVRSRSALRPDSVLSPECRCVGKRACFVTAMTANFVHDIDDDAMAESRFGMLQNGSLSLTCNDAAHLLPFITLRSILTT